MARTGTGGTLRGARRGNASFAGLPLRPPQNATGPGPRCGAAAAAGAPLMHTIATRFTRLRSGTLLALFAGALPGGPASCPAAGGGRGEGCCGAAHFFASEDGGAAWAHRGSFAADLHAAFQPLCADGGCAAVGGVGEASTVAELADGSLLCVWRSEGGTLCR